MRECWADCYHEYKRAQRRRAIVLNVAFSVWLIGGFLLLSKF
jgi:hypothetical protein